MKHYLSSVLIERGKSCDIPIPIYLCKTLGLKNDNFLSNLFDHEKSCEIGNRYEIVISPFKRAELDSVYRMRMRVGSGTGTTHKVLELLKSEKMFEFDVRAIDAIDAISAVSGEVAVTGIVGHGDQSRFIWPKLLKSNWQFPLGGEKQAHQWQHTFFENPEKASDKGVCLIVEKSFFGTVYRDDKSKILVDEPTEIYSKNGDNENLYIKINAPLISKIWPASTQKYSFVSIRLDEERSAIVITLKNPREKLFLFNLQLEEEADIRRVTHILSNFVGLNFRSISSVTNSDRSVEVKLAANVTDSGFENLSPELIEEYIQIKNENQNLVINNTEDIVKPLLFCDDQYPNLKELKKLFKFSWFEFGNVKKKRFTLKSSHDQHTLQSVYKLCHRMLTKINSSNAINLQDLKKVIDSNVKYQKVKITFEKDYPQIVMLSSGKNDTTSWNAFIRADCYFIIGWSNDIPFQSPLGKCQKTISSLVIDLKQIFISNVVTYRSDFSKLYHQILVHIVENIPLAINKNHKNIYYQSKLTGQGKSGKVYPGVRYREIKPEKVAVKLSEYALNLAEAKILGRKCPNLVKYEEFFDLGGKSGFLILMEFLHGRTLQEILNKPINNEFNITENNWNSILRSIFKEILTGVEYIHKEKSIIHLDLKPDNIMVLYKGQQVKILDYGLSGFEEGHKVRIDSKRQDPAYMAPEVLKMNRGEVKALPSMDIFSLGVLLSVLFLDEHPYLDYIDLKGKIEPSKNSKVTIYGNFSSVIYKACSYEPSSRYSSVREFGEHLFSSWKKIKAPTKYSNNSVIN